MSVVALGLSVNECQGPECLGKTTFIVAMIRVFYISNMVRVIPVRNPSVVTAHLTIVNSQALGCFCSYLTVRYLTALRFTLGSHPTPCSSHFPQAPLMRDNPINDRKGVFDWNSFVAHPQLGELGPRVCGSVCATSFSLCQTTAFSTVNLPQNHSIHVPHLDDQPYGRVRYPHCPAQVSRHFAEMIGNAGHMKLLKRRTRALGKVMFKYSS